MAAVPPHVGWVAAVAALLLHAGGAAIAAAFLLPVGAMAATLTGPLPESVEPRQYRVHLKILPELERFSGTAEIDVTLRQPARTITLHGRGLHVVKAYARDSHGHELIARYTEVHPAGVVELSFDTALDAGDATLVFDYDAPFSTAFRGLVKLTRGEDVYVVSRMVPISARMVIPSFDEPRFKVPFTFVVTAHRDHAIIANTKAVSTELLEDGLRRVTFATSKPLSTSLLALSVGPFDQREGESIPPNEHRREAVPLRASAGKGQGDELTYLLGITGGLIQEHERYLATAYPFQKLEMLAMPADVRGAAANAAAPSYGESVVLRNDRTPLTQRRYLDYVHAHELAHQWFANYVTSAWWSDSWMNEAFAEWLSFGALVRWAPERDYQRQLQRNALAAMERDSRIDARPIYVPVATTDDLGGLSDLKYAKGAAVIRMFENDADPSAFRSGVRAFVRRFAFGTASTDDLLQSLEQGAARPRLAAAFRTFLTQPGVPLVELDWRCAGQEMSVRYEQSRYTPLGARFDARGRWELPLCLSYSQADERKKHCQRIDGAKGTFRVPVTACPSAVMPNADGAGYYRFALGEERMRGLVEHVHELTAAEALSLEDSLAAGMESGRIDAAAYLVAVPRFAKYPAWDVAVAPLPRLTLIMHSSLEGVPSEAAQTFARELYRPLLKRVGLSGLSTPDGFTSEEAAQLRNLLIPFLALEARDPPLRAQLTAIGRAAMGFDRHSPATDLSGLDPVLIETAVRVAAQTLGRPFAEHAWKALETKGPGPRIELTVAALASQSDVEFANLLRERLLSSSLPDEVLGALLVAQARAPEHRDAFWAWARPRLGSLSERWPRQMQAMLTAAGGLCDKSSASGVSAMFAPVTRDLDGGEQAVQATAEQIERCAAFSARQMESARGFTW